MGYPPRSPSSEGSAAEKRAWSQAPATGAGGFSRVGLAPAPAPSCPAPELLVGSSQKVSRQRRRPRPGFHSRMICDCSWRRPNDLSPPPVLAMGPGAARETALTAPTRVATGNTVGSPARPPRDTARPAQTRGSVTRRCSTWNGTMKSDRCFASRFHVEQSQVLTSGRRQARIGGVLRRFGSPI